MRLTCKLAMLVLLLLFTGCAIKHNYTWNEYPITPDRMSAQSSFTEGKEIKIIKGKSSDTQTFLGSVGAHQYYGSQQSLTDGIADQLAKELRNKRINVNSMADKSLEIAVNRSNFERGAWKIAASLDFTVRFGNDKTKSYTVRNSSPATVDRAYNGAVALAVIKIMNDQEVLAYINE